MAHLGRSVRSALDIGWKFWLAVAVGLAFAGVYELAVHWIA